MLAGCVPWPAEFAQRYRHEGYWTGETLGELLRGWAREHARRVAVIDGDRRWTYAELDHRADRLAAGLHARGIKSQDRVVVQLPNAAEFIVLYFALFRLGALPVLALPAHRFSEITQLCSVSEAVAYVVPSVHHRFDYRELAAQVRARAPALRHVFVLGDPGEFTALDEVAAEPVELPAPDPGDVALFLLSGGTTGPPKLIPRTHDDYVYNVRISARNARLSADSVYLAVLPIAHNYALGCPGVLGTLMAGGTVVLAAGGDPEEAFALIARERVTISALVPALALQWMDAARTLRPDLSYLRLLQVGGARFSPGLARRLPAVLGCALQQSYGMAEGLLSQTGPGDDADAVVHTQGRPLSPADELRIVDGSGRDVTPGEVGQLLVRGPYTLRGYYRAAAYNADAFTEDGFFRTGDLVRITGSGHLVVEGRVKDVINRGGNKVPVAEVEDHLLAHPAVRDIAIVAMPDALLGERSCAFVVPEAKLPAAEPIRLVSLVRFLRDRGVADYKLPDRIEVVASLPRTGIGKVNKAQLRELIAAQQVGRLAATTTGRLR